MKSFKLLGLFVPLLLLAVAFFSPIIDVKANPDPSATEQSLSQAASAVPDTVKTTFTKVYEDIKEGLTGLASGLKVGVTHVYAVLVKQQVVRSVTYVILYLILSITGIVLIRKSYNILKENDSDTEGLGIFLGIAGGVVTVIVLILFTFTIDNTVTGFLNPEYGAIKEIISFVSDKGR